VTGTGRQGISLRAPRDAPGPMIMHVNAHTHLYSGLAPLGMPAPAEAPRNFVEILAKIWWRLDRALDEATLRAAARYYVAHARRAGTVALVDHHESPGFIEDSLDVLADACDEFGVAAVLCYGATERNAGVGEACRCLDECRRFILDNRRARVAGVVGLHASFTVSDETIRLAGELCRELGTVLHVHVAEDAADVEDARRRGYAGPLQRLIALDALPPGSILAHGVHLTPDEVRQASDAGCWFVQNPRSNRNNGVGYPLALTAASRVALGTDGFASDMDDEAAALRECSAAAGESADAIAERPGAGWALLEERLRLSRGEIEAGAGPEPGGAVMDAIDAEARAQAARLWARW
jgi:cytosine/adenosine deaminase-related metal-dependent hydrolase